MGILKKIFVRIARINTPEDLAKRAIWGWERDLESMPVLVAESSLPDKYHEAAIRELGALCFVSLQFAIKQLVSSNSFFRTSDELTDFLLDETRKRNLRHTITAAFVLERYDYYSDLSNELYSDELSSKENLHKFMEAMSNGLERFCHGYVPGGPILISGDLWAQIELKSLALYAWCHSTEFFSELMERYDGP